MSEKTITEPPCPSKRPFRLHSEVVLSAPLDTVFRFFADAHNLDRITPPFLRFVVLTPGSINMQVGARIEYALRVHGLPIRWTSEITVWDPPHRFVDQQIRGPYRWWRHEHRFEEIAGATRVIDDVEYVVPGGRLIHWLFVQRDLRRIFEHRRQALAQLLP